LKSDTAQHQFLFLTHRGRRRHGQKVRGNHKEDRSGTTVPTVHLRITGNNNTIALSAVVVCNHFNNECHYSALSAHTQQQQQQHQQQHIHPQSSITSPYARTMSRKLRHVLKHRIVRYLKPLQIMDPLPQQELPVVEESRVGLQYNNRSNRVRVENENFFSPIYLG